MSHICHDGYHLYESPVSAGKKCQCGQVEWKDSDGIVSASEFNKLVERVKALETRIFPPEPESFDEFMKRKGRA